MKINKRKFALLLILAFLVSTAVSLIYTSLSAREVKEIDMHLTVGDHVGFNVDTDAIYFGTIPPGSRGSRRLGSVNNGSFPKKIKITASGELADWVWLEENNFVLNKNETKEIKIYVSPPADAEFGNYTGKLKISFRKVYISLQLF